MLVKDAMTKAVIIVTPQTKITEVAKILHENSIHGLPVVDNGKLVGIITETDFFTKGENDIYLPSYVAFLKNINATEDVSEKYEKDLAKLIDAKAEDIMSNDCITLFPDSDIRAMLALIREARLHSIPVVDENEELVGIITVADIIKLI